MKQRIAISIMTCVVMGISHTGSAQSADEIRQTYPGEQAVVLNHTMNYKISVKDGQPMVQSDETQQLLYLSSAAGAYMSQYGFTHSSFHVLEQYEAYTKTAQDKKIKVSDFKTTDSKSDGIFYDDVKETSFDFPAVAPGSVGTLHVTMMHKDAHLLSPFFFYRSIPVIKGELTITFPKDMSVKYQLVGNNTDRIAFTRETHHGEIEYTFSVKDCPAEKPYSDAPDFRWYSPHVVFYIEKYQDEKGQTIPWLGNLDDLYRLDQGYLAHVNKSISPELTHIVDSLIKGHPGMEEKARLVYNWVQNNIKYVAFEQGMEGFIPRDASLVCSRRFGDCKDMSSILTIMLRAAGVPAWYTWIGTRSLPYSYSVIPTPIVDNHMICTIQLNGKYIFLDGTDPTCIFGMPTEMIQNKEALVATGDSSYQVLTVPTMEKEQNQLIDTTILQLTPTGLMGTITTDLTGYYSMRMHGLLSYTQDKNLEDYMKARFARGSNKFHLDSFTIGDTKDKDHIRIGGRFTLQDYARHIGNEWYLNLNLFKFYEHEEIDYPKRKMPIEYDFRNKRKYVIILKIPDGYQVSYLPKSKTFHNAVWGFDCVYEQKPGELILTQEFDNDHILLQPDQFQDWNKVLENLFPLYRETVGLAPARSVK